MARLDRLDAAKEVAQRGAALGREFPYALLRSVSLQEAPRLHAGLAQLVDAEILYQRGEPPAATYTFKHALIQETAYQSLLKRTRQQLHARIAQVLEERFPERVAAEPEVIARHYDQAGLATQAIAHYQRAGERAAQRSANEEAIDAQTPDHRRAARAGHGRAREAFEALPLSYAPTWGADGAARGDRGDLRRASTDEHVLAFAGAEEAMFWALQELLRPGRPRGRHRAQLPVDGVAGDARPAPTSTGSCCARRTAGRSTSTRWRRCCGPTRGSWRSTSPTTRRARCPTARRSCALVELCDERGIRLFSDEVYRGLELDPARTLPQAADLSRARALAERDVEGLRAARAADRLARLPRPRAARAAGAPQALHVDLQRRPERAPGHDRAAERRADPRPQPRDHRRQPAGLRRVLRPLARALRVGAAAGRLRLLPAPA